MEEKPEISPSYPAWMHQKAIEMLKRGFSKNKISQELKVGFTTIRRWTAGLDSPYSISYPEETKRKAIELARSGVSRVKIAKDLNAGYYSVLAWTRGINTWQKRPSFPTKLRKKVRRMVRMGMKKREVAGLLTVPYYDICSWTADIHSTNSRLSGVSEKILAEIMEKGYFMPKSAQLNACRILRQNLGLRLTRTDGIWICYAPKYANEAVKGLLERSRTIYLSSYKLSKIKSAFNLA